MRKTDSPRKRMREVEFRAPKVKRSIGTRQVYADSRPEVRNLAWMAAARGAIKIEQQEFTLPSGEKVPSDIRAITRLFREFNLDPNDPWSWRQFVEYLAYIYFWEPPKRSVGAPKRTDERELEAALATLTGHSNAEAARKLARRFAKGNSTSGLRRRIAKVRAKSKVGR